MSRLFRAHGDFCAAYPWEVIVATLTLTTCLLTVDQQYGGGLAQAQMQHEHVTKPPIRHCVECINELEYNAADVTVMTLIRVLAILYSYYRFLQVRRLGSKYILGIAGLFTVFSSFIFTSTVLNFLRIDVTDLKDALFFFLLLNDLSKAAMLAEFALSAADQEEVRKNIARGMSVLGPSITLDTLVETLVLGVGTLSGVHRLEMLSYFACLSVVVNYMVFMTFYPSCLSLILELSRSKLILGGRSGSLLSRALQEADQKPNPVVQRVKLIMSCGLMLVHAHSWWPIRDEDDAIVPLVEQRMVHNRTEETALHGYIMKWVTLSAENIVVLVLLLALLVKFVFFENDELAQWRAYIPTNSDSSATCGPTNSTGTTSNSSATSAASLLPTANGKPTAMRRRGISLGSDRFSAIATVNMPVNAMHTNGTVKVSTSSGRLVVPKTTSVAPLESKAVQTDSDTANTANTSSTIGNTTSGAEVCINAVAKLAPLAAAANIAGDTNNNSDNDTDKLIVAPLPARSLDECLRIYQTVNGLGRAQNARTLTDEEVLLLVKNKHIPAYKMETELGDPERGVGIRRKLVGDAGDFYRALDDLPYKNYDYSRVMGACCENVIGYVPIPVGVAGPLRLDGRLVYVPMATTEGCLIASTNRGCRALMQRGVTSRVVADGMTRGPVVRFPSVARASEAMAWLENTEKYNIVKSEFDSSSRFARLTRVQMSIAGRLLFIRFVARTGDAMGMNMLSKGTELALNAVKTEFPDMEVLSLSGNFCTDKKPAAINWIEGRGKSVVCEAVVPAAIVKNVLKTSVPALIDVNIAKNMVGSAMAGSIGGQNAHAANIVTALYIATGQDPAQNVASSNCMTLMESSGETGDDLYISCTMPSIEVGTIGGGTILGPQGACLDMLGVRGAHPTRPGENASQLARVVCAAVLAGELSLMAALTAGHLVKSHLQHNRSSTTSGNATPAQIPIVGTTTPTQPPPPTTTSPPPPTSMPSEVPICRNPDNLI